MSAGQRRIFRAFLMLVCFGAVHTQRHFKIPRTKFSCHGRVTGYYADVETGCQIYHMCDGLGRQFSYACPNTTLFQQRMLICDHWYMVNCSHSERDYSANLLIGQKDKPFVSDDEDHQRTPRPDILSAPYAHGDNYYGFNKGHDSGKYENVDENIANGHNDINDEVALFSVPTHWSTELTGGHHHTTTSPFKHEHHEHDREHSHEHSHEKHGEHHHVPEHHQEHHPEHHPEHHAEHHAEHHPEHHAEHHPEHHNGEHHNPEHHNMEIIITEPQHAEHHNEHHHEHEVMHHSDHQAFTGRPIIVGFPTSGEFSESEVVHNKHTFVTESNTEAPKISEILTNHGIELVVNLPSELFEPPNHEMTSIASTESEEGEGHHHHRLSSTTVRSIANFNNQFISSEAKSHERGSHESQEKTHSGENSKEIDEPEPFIEFIKRFDPNEEAPIRSSFEKDQIESKTFEIQSSSETSGFVPIVNNNHIHHAQPSKTAHHSAHPTKHTIKINIQSDSSGNSREIILENEAPKPISSLVPPKLDYSEFDSSTVGPPIYYEWKWAPHALGLEPPTFSKESKDVPEFMARKSGRPAFALPRPTTAAPVLEPSKIALDQNNEIKLAPYFIPKYDFPLDKEHPGYNEDGALSSFQVKLSRNHDFKNDGSHPNYAENPECPECHPSFLQPGSCTPCVTIKR